MTTKHFKERFTERVGGLDISLEEMIILREKSERLCQRSTVESESICIHIFDNDTVYKDGEDELWIMIRDNTLVTTWRRDSTNRKYTNEYGMKVQKVSYELN